MSGPGEAGAAMGGRGGSGAANPSQAQAVVLVDELARCGLVDVVLAPGSRSAALALAFDADRRVRLHVRVDERSAAFCALGLSRASRRPTAVVTTSGSAAANLHPAVVEADAARVGLLAVTADRPPELRGTAANQTIDQVKLYGDAVRWFCEVGVAEARPDAVGYWRSVACRAWAAASGAVGPAGPVHLNVAFREPLVATGGGEAFPYPLDGRPGGAPWTASRPTARRPDPDDVAWLAERAGAAVRGVVVAGDADTDAAAVVALAEAAGWPLLAEPQSGARAGANAVSTFDLLLGDAGFAAGHRPDLVVAVGRPLLSKALSAWLDAGVEQVLVDADGAWLDPGRALGRVVVADPGLCAAAVAGRLGPPRRAPRRSPSPWLGSWIDAEARARRAVDACLDGDDAPSEPRVARDLADAAPAGAVLTVASSMPVRDLNAVMRPRRGLRVLGNRGASGIDGFVSTALGVAAAHDGPAFALAGDLSLLHDANGLLVSAGPRPDLVMVVVNNDGGGIFSFLPQAAVHGPFERLFATPHGLDFARLADVHGCGHTLVGRAGELGGALDAARAAGGVQLVEVRTEREANVAVHRRLAAAVSAGLAAR